jgi:hypothetical protein
LTVNDIALLGVEKVDSSVPPSALPENSVELGEYLMPLSVFGLPELPQDGLSVPTFFPTLSPDLPSIWQMVDQGTIGEEVVFVALLWLGYSEKMAWTIVKNDKYAPAFFEDLKYCRSRVYDYHSGAISYVELLGSVVAFQAKNFYRAWRGSVISKEMLNLDSVDKMAGAGLERIAPNLLLLLVLQECPPDVPTKIPTLSAKIAPLDHALTPDFLPSGGGVVYPLVAATHPYNDEDMVSLSIPKPVAVTSDGNPKHERSQQ